MSAEDGKYRPLGAKRKLVNAANNVPNDKDKSDLRHEKRGAVSFPASASSSSAARVAPAARVLPGLQTPDAESISHFQDAVIHAIDSRQDVICQADSESVESAICQGLVYSTGTTFVFTPSRDLMDAAAQGCKEHGLHNVVAWKGGSRTLDAKLERDVPNGRYAVVYLAVEKAIPESSTKFMKMLSGMSSGGHIAAFVFSKVHTLETHASFRPQMDLVYVFRDRFPEVPILALTSACDQKQALRLTKSLRLKNPTHFSIRTSNRFYRVLPKESDTHAIASSFDLITSSAFKGKPGILVSNLKSKAEKFSVEINDRFSKEQSAEARFRRPPRQPVAFLHFGVEVERKKKTIDAFESGSLDVICSTSHIALCPLKQDIRYIVLSHSPLSLADLVRYGNQAGQDGDCVAFYNSKDWVFNVHRCYGGDDFGESSLSSSDKEDCRYLANYKLGDMNQLHEFLLDNCTCRHVECSFGEISHKCLTMCDNCTNPTPTVKVDLQEYAKDLVFFVSNFPDPDRKLVNFEECARAFSHNSASVSSSSAACSSSASSSTFKLGFLLKISGFGGGSHFSELVARRVAARLFTKGILKLVIGSDFTFFPLLYEGVVVSDKASAFIAADHRDDFLFEIRTSDRRRV